MVWDDQLANSSLPYCKYGSIDLLEMKIVSNSLIELQDVGEGLHQHSVGLKVSQELLCKLSEPHKKLKVAFLLA